MKRGNVTCDQTQVRTRVKEQSDTQLKGILEAETEAGRVEVSGLVFVSLSAKKKRNRTESAEGNMQVESSALSRSWARRGFRAEVPPTDARVLSAS